MSRTIDSSVQADPGVQPEPKGPVHNGQAHDGGPSMDEPSTVAIKLGLVAPPPTAPIIDPSKLTTAKLRLASTCSTSTVGGKGGGKVELRRPYSTAYCRVLDGLANRMDVAIYEPAKSRTYYLVTADAQPDFPGPLSNRTLFVTVEKGHEDRPFLWPVVIPDLDNSFGGVLAYAEAAESALTQWTRIEWVASKRKHEITKVKEGGYEPSWPEIDLTKMVLAAFDRRIITDHEHEVVRELRGDWRK